MTQAYALFETAIGSCGVVFGAHGISAVQLPETSHEKTRARLLRCCAGAMEAAPPPAIQAAIDDIVALLDGELRDLSGVAVDLDGVSGFNRRVYAVTRAIPPGATLTYGEIAARIGEPGASRAVGAALGQNPVPIIVPCHRVLAADGRMGGFSAPGGRATKLRLLAIEGAFRNVGSLFGDLPLALAPERAR